MNYPQQKAFPQQFGSPAPSGRSKHGYSQGQSSSSGRGKNDRVNTSMSMLPNELKIPKPPKQPDKPLPAYMRYSRKVWEKVKSQNPDMKMWDIGKLIGEQWRNLPEDERQGFFAEYEVEKAEYQEAMKAYHTSPAYRDWLKVKERATNALQEQQMMEKMMGGPLPKEEPRFQLQQIDEEEDDTEHSAKQVASARFQRNHKLIADIFSEATVPDIKTIVTRPRLENLKRQVQSLMQHQRKLETEIEEMESKFMAKKQKIMDKTSSFIQRMKEFDEKNEKLLIESKKALENKENEIQKKADDSTCLESEKRTVKSPEQNVENTNPSEKQLEVNNDQKMEVDHSEDTNVQMKSPPLQNCDTLSSDNQSGDSNMQAHSKVSIDKNNTVSLSTCPTTTAETSSENVSPVSNNAPVTPLESSNQTPKMSTSPIIANTIVNTDQIMSSPPNSNEVNSQPQVSLPETLPSNENLEEIPESPDQSSANDKTV